MISFSLVLLRGNRKQRIITLVLTKRMVDISFVAYQLLTALYAYIVFFGAMSRLPVLHQVEHA